MQSRKKVDSLRHELSMATSDSTRIRLRFILAVKTRTWRESLWDTLLAETRANHMQIYEAKTLIGRGRLHIFNGADDKGIDCINKAYALAEQLSDKVDMMNALYSIADFYLTKKNEVKAALDLCFKALKLGEEIQDKPGIANIYSLIASCYWANGETQRALNMHLKCLKAYRELNNHFNILRTLSDIGTDYHALHNKDSSIKYYLACKPYLAEFGKLIEVIEPYLSVSSAYTKLGQNDSALKYAKIAYDIAEAYKQQGGLLSVRSAIAGIYFQQGKNQLAKKTILDVLDSLKVFEFKQQVPPLYDLLHQVYLKERNYQQALEAYKNYISARDSLSDETDRKQALEKEFNYSLEKKENANKLLAQQNRIQGLLLKQDRYTLVGLAIALAVLLLLLTIAYLFFRQNKLRNEQKSARLEQKLLRAQMNPHFIFNSLQTIQNFVLKEDKKHAVGYLGSFAEIMRSVLENSRMEAISLREEISLLKNYLALQQQRYGGRFDYSITVSDAIDINMLTVPPMLTQPFIENAVEHGFHGIESGGQITVSYSLLGNNLIMEITDNGMGMRDNQYATKKHPSRAIEITRERIELLNKQSKEKASFIIIPAFSQAMEHKGVKVRFILPLN